MKNKTQKIIYLVFAIIAGFIDYVVLATSKSLCYYAGDGQRNFQEFRDICYAEYHSVRILLEIFSVSLIFYLITFYTIKLISSILREENTMKKIIAFTSMFFLTISILYVYLQREQLGLTSKISKMDDVKSDSTLFTIKTFPNSTFDKKETMKFIWLDNSNVLFASCLKDTAKSCESFGLVLWNVDDNNFKITFQSERFPRLDCRDGNTVLMTVNKEKFGVDVSNLDDIKVNLRNDNEYSEEYKKGIITSDIRCPNTLIRPEQFDDHLLKVLHPNDGYLTMGKMSEYNPTQPIELVSEDLSSRIKLNITQEEAGLAKVTYVPNREAYFLYNSNLSSEKLALWQGGEDRNAWFIKSNGETQKISVPSGPWAQQSGDKQIFPVKRGLIITSAGFLDKWGINPGSAGIYFLSDDQNATKILTGFISSVSTSPDGCRAVFNFLKDFGQDEPNKRMFVDICNE